MWHVESLARITPVRSGSGQPDHTDMHARSPTVQPTQPSKPPQLSEEFLRAEIEALTRSANGCGDRPPLCRPTIPSLKAGGPAARSAIASSRWQLPRNHRSGPQRSGVACNNEFHQHAADEAINSWRCTPTPSYSAPDNLRQQFDGPEDPELRARLASMQ